MEESTIIVGGQEAPGQATAQQGETQSSTQQQTSTSTPSALGGGTSTIAVVVMYAAIFAAAYFFWIRPQKKKEKEMVKMRDSVKAGDSVVTTSGFYGKVVNVYNDCFLIEFGSNKGVRIPVNKADVVGVREPNMTVSEKS